MNTIALKCDLKLLNMNMIYIFVKTEGIYLLWEDQCVCVVW